MLSADALGVDKIDTRKKLWEIHCHGDSVLSLWPLWIRFSWSFANQPSRSATRVRPGALMCKPYYLFYVVYTTCNVYVEIEYEIRQQDIQIIYTSILFVYFMLSRIFFCYRPPTNAEHQRPWWIPNAWSQYRLGLERVQAFRPLAGANIYYPIPRTMSWPAIVAGVYPPMPLLTWRWSCYY